jgi:hypothetical protein
MTVDLTKADFVANLPFSTQIEDSQIRPFITNAYTLDLLPALGHETLEQLQLIPAFTYVPWAGPASLPSIQQGVLIDRRERLYKALLPATTLEPPIEEGTIQLTFPPTPPVSQQNGQWLYKRLETLWAIYLKPYWLQAAYVRFLLQHGVNVTKAGLTVPIDRTNGTYDRPSSAQVAQLLADARITAEARLSRLTRFLKLNGLLYFYDPATGGGYYGADGYERVPGDPPLTADERARYRPNRRHKSPFRGV